MNEILQHVFFRDFFLNCVNANTCSCYSFIFFSGIIFHCIFIQWMNICSSCGIPFGLIHVLPLRIVLLRTFCKHCLSPMCKCNVLRGGIVGWVCTCLLLLDLYFYQQCINICIKTQTWSLVDLQAGPGSMKDSSPTPGVLGLTPTVPMLGAVSRPQPWESNVLLRSFGWYMWLNPVKASVYTFKILVVECRDLLILQPPTSMDWSAPSVSPCPLWTRSRLQTKNEICFLLLHLFMNT